MNRRQFKVTPDIAERLYADALFSANHIHLDELRADSARRVTSNQSITWAASAILKSDRPHLTVIERQSFNELNSDYFEFAMSTMGNVPEYILWIHVPIIQAETIIEKYKLAQWC